MAGLNLLKSFKNVKFGRNLSFALSTKITVRNSNLSTDTQLTESELQDVLTTTKNVVEKHVNPYIQEWEDAKIAPLHKIFKKFAEFGLLGISKPVEYSGLGLSYKTQMLVNQEIGGCRCGSIPMALGVQTDMATPALAKHGSDFLKKNFLEPSITGDIVSCIGVSEAHAGSDVSNIKSTAVLDTKTDEYVINGGKMWTTNVTQADWMCMIVKTESESKNVHLNKSLLVVPLNLPGIKIVNHDMGKMGMLSSDWGQSYFDNVRVPKSYLIGEPGKGFIYQMEQFQFERMVAAAACIKPFETLLKETAEYCKDRKIFGKPLIKNQSVAFKLSELSTEVELIKALLYATADKADSGFDVTKQASMLKFKCGQLSRTLPDICLQYHGAQGYLQNSYVNRMHRDLRVMAIGGGADEVMLQIISKLLKY